MLPLLLVLLPGGAQAASLDALQVGGVWGSPTSTEPTAAWWNPAALAAAPGHRVFIEAAPTWANFEVDRSDPHAGSDRYTLSGVLPYAGLASDLTVKGLGVGLALAVPMARGGTAEDPIGPGRYAMRDSEIRTLHGILGVAYEIEEKVAIGLAGHLVASSWAATVDNDTMVDLYDETFKLGETPSPEIYNDSNLENERYAATLAFGPLHDTTFTWAMGLRVQPTRLLAFGLSHIRPYSLSHQGAVTIDFDCPPDTDSTGRFGAEKFGICNASMQGNATVSYDLPARWHLGAEIRPTEGLTIEVFGGLVTWSRFTDFHIQVTGIGEQNLFDSDEQREATSALVEQDRLWARQHVNSGFGAVDVKGEPVNNLTLGGRILFDKAAIPDEAVSANNWDADELVLTGLVAYRPIKALRIGLTGTRHFAADRTITTSGFGMTLAEEERKPDRWFYPHANGTYRGSITQLGISLLAEI